MYHRDPFPKIITIALILSGLLHLLFFLMISDNYLGRLFQETNEVELISIKGPKWIMDIDPRLKSEDMPEDAKILSDFNQMVEDETVAEYGFEEQAPKIIKPSKEEPSTNKFYEVDGDFFLLGKKEISRKEGSIVSKGPIVGDTVMLPEEFYRDYKVGDKVYLNVARFRGAKYFVKLGKVLAVTYNPIPVLRYYHSVGELKSGYIATVVAVSIKKDGNLSELFVIKSSGLPKYDEEALRIFRASSPFFTPPEFLLSEKDTLDFAVVVPTRVF
ncbi:TonB C-terminal domain-containing protein [bacterium]|nr:TonB C-terminal domain-containing protein [bacterium]